MPNNPAGDFRVVCLAGSAGGLKAYLDILRLLPVDTGMAFVIAPHRGTEHPLLLPQLLRLATSMPVFQVTEGMRIEPNRVFVMPARHQMTLDRDIFHLRTTPGPADWRMTINIFLSSLAEAKGRCAVAAVLSDMDVDGCAALENIKGAGGVTFAQSDASYDSMPRHAMATGHVDFPLPAADIARSLLKLGR